MILVTAATEFEIKAFNDHCDGLCDYATCVTGIGPVETAVRLYSYLTSTQREPDLVVNIGIAGAYFNQHTNLGLLDICLAEKEILGDFGICFDDSIEPFSTTMITQELAVRLNAEVLERAKEKLNSIQVNYFTGNFVTVNGVSGTRARGQAIADQHDGLCENMEGFAAARVCQDFALPMLEIRCISNMVEDRNKKNWKLQEAADKCGKIAALLIKDT